MERWLGRFSDPFYAVFRIVFGLLMTCHGADKLFGAFGGPKATTPLMTIGGVVEFAGGLMVALGVFAGFGAFFVSGMMAVAYFMAHFPKGFWPIKNGGELAVAYCFAFLYIASRGSGRFGLIRSKL